MNRSYFEIILLYCLEQINGERSIYSIYHLFNGKKSSQTIQDAHIFGITSFFHVFPRTSRTFFDQTITNLENDTFVSKLADQNYVLTNLGRECLQVRLQHDPFPKYLNGWNYHLITDLFWSRLSLLIQVASNLKQNETKYIPIQKNKEIQNWLKQFFKKYKQEKHQLATQLYEELVFLLAESETNPSTFVIRLTGYHSIGLTEEQAADVLKMERTYYQVQFLNVIHYLINRLEKKEVDVPLLHSIVVDLKINEPLTASTQRTYEWIQKGYTIEQIAIMRKLKESTIEDHIVEIAFNRNDFDISPYVSEKKLKNILFAVNETTSKQLKHIRHFTEDASYFEIRLVLAKYGAKQWN